MAYPYKGFSKRGRNRTPKSRVRHSARAAENIRLARIRRVQKRPAALKYRGPVILPPPPLLPTAEGEVALFDPSHRGASISAIDF